MAGKLRVFGYVEFERPVRHVSEDVRRSLMRGPGVQGGSWLEARPWEGRSMEPPSLDSNPSPLCGPRQGFLPFWLPYSLL